MRPKSREAIQERLIRTGDLSSRLFVLTETLMSYRPQPIDTSSVPVTQDLIDLTKLLAENAHEVWAAKRQAEGWKLGPKKDGDLKETPLLVAYGQLPESEKQYDREIVLETLRAAIALGYRIEKPGR